MLVILSYPPPDNVSVQHETAADRSSVCGGALVTVHKQALLFFSCSGTVQQLTGSDRVGKYSNSEYSFSLSKGSNCTSTNFAEFVL